MGNQVSPWQQCTRDPRLRGTQQMLRPVGCGHTDCRRPCSDENKDPFSCDPAGAVFDDTTRQLPEMDRLAFRLAGGTNLAALRWLFVYGANAQVCDINNSTLLHAACRTGSVQVIKDLVRRGLSLNTTDSAGWTPLHVASCMGRQDVSLYLLHSGADPEAKNFRGQTPQELCSNCRLREVVEGYDTHLRMRPMQPRPDALASGASSASAPAGLHFEPFFVPRDLILQDAEHQDELQRIGKVLFDVSPGHGIAFLVATGTVPDYPVNINRFLLRSNVSPERYGEFLGEEFPIAQTLRLEFLNSLPLVGTGLVSALEVAFRHIAVPVDWEKVDRLTKGISYFWWLQHAEDLEVRRTERAAGLPRSGAPSSSTSRAPVGGGSEEMTGSQLFGCLGGPEGLHQLMFSTIMLRQWLQSGHKLSLNEWAHLNTGIDEKGTDIPMSVQAGIYASVVEEVFVVKRGVDPKPAISPVFEGWGFVRYSGRAQSSGQGDPAAWFRQAPRVLAAQGGVTSAGMAFPASPTNKGSSSSSAAAAAAAPLGVDAGEGQVVGKPACAPLLTDCGLEGVREEGEDRAWMMLYSSVLLLAHAPDVAPYAFVSLPRTVLTGTMDGAPTSASRLCFQGRPVGNVEGTPSKEPPKFADNANWLDLCLLLGDGRYQLLEAPQLEVRLNPGDLHAWAVHLGRHCAESATFRF